MKAVWKRDSEGDYSLTLPSGATAWIAKGAGSKSQKPWYGRVTGTTGTTLCVSGWTLRVAKSAAEILLGISHDPDPIQGGHQGSGSISGACRGMAGHRKKNVSGIRPGRVPRTRTSRQTSAPLREIEIDPRRREVNLTTNQMIAMFREVLEGPALSNGDSG